MRQILDGNVAGRSYQTALSFASTARIVSNAAKMAMTTDGCKLNPWTRDTPTCRYFFKGGQFQRAWVFEENIDVRESLLFEVEGCNVVTLLRSLNEFQRSNQMSIPEFTADAALNNTTKGYLLASVATLGTGGVQPQGLFVNPNSDLVFCDSYVGCFVVRHKINHIIR
jgi:hypothetical protein